MDHNLKVERSGRVVGWVDATTKASEGPLPHAIVDVRDMRAKDPQNGKAYTKQLILVPWNDIDDWAWEEIAPSEISSTASLISSTARVQ